MESNPWKKLNTRLIYENEWISVREDQVIRPDGEKGIYGVVDTRIAVGIIALTPDNEIYLVGQYRYPIDKYSWEIVEGGSDPDEDPLVTAKRELKEEAGLTAGSWRQLGGIMYLSNCHSSEEAVVFVATDLVEGSSSPDGTEMLRSRKVPFAEALEMVDWGEIDDALSILGILRLAREFNGSEDRLSK